MKSKKKNPFNNILTLLIFFLLITLPIYFTYKTFFLKKDTTDFEDESMEEVKGETEEKYIEIPNTEIVDEIDGEIAYIALPPRIYERKPPIIVVYSHGSNTRVTPNREDEFMQDLHSYGLLFTANNFIFAASNQHGENWGNEQSLQDTLSMVEWIKENYSTEEKIYMLGFSMGGLPTLNFATKYPEMVSKIALLAPTTVEEEWNMERVNKISNMDIQIWHGTADVNVGYSLSATFIEKLKAFDRDIPLITLEGKTHWDLEPEYMEDVLKFFLND